MGTASPIGACGELEGEVCVPHATRKCALRNPAHAAKVGECRCDEACKAFGDCCDDYQDGVHQRAETRSSVVTPVSPPNPCPGTSSTSCSVGCYSSLLGNGVCDTACNLASCGFDQGDCSAVAPAGWLCAASKYGDGKCDCGVQCGIVDTDCLGSVGTVYGCPWEGSQQDACCTVENGVGLCAVPSSTGTCSRGNVPAQWFCAPSSWGDDKCDCECGTFDPACSILSSNVTGCPFDNADLNAGALCCADVSGYGYCSARDGATCAIPTSPVNLAVPAGSLTSLVAPIQTGGTTVLPVRAYSLQLTIAVTGNSISQYGRTFSVSVAWANEAGNLTMTSYPATITPDPEIVIPISQSFAGNAVTVIVVVDSELRILESTRADNSIDGSFSWIPVIETVYPLTNGGVVPIGAGAQWNTYLALLPKTTASQLLTATVAEVAFYYRYGNASFSTAQPRVCTVPATYASTYATRVSFPCQFDVAQYVNNSFNDTGSAFHALIAIATSDTGVASIPVTYNLKPMFLPKSMGDFILTNLTAPGSGSMAPDELPMKRRSQEAAQERHALHEEHADVNLRTTTAPSTSCTSIPQYYVGFSGNDVAKYSASSVTSYEDCCAKCAAYSGCVGFSYYPASTSSDRSYVCYLKNKLESFTTSSGSTQSDVITGLMSPYNGYQIVPQAWMLSSAGRLAQYTSISNAADCFGKCEATSSCTHVLYSAVSLYCYTMNMDSTTPGSFYYEDNNIFIGLKITYSNYMTVVPFRYQPTDTGTTYGYSSATYSTDKTVIECASACKTTSSVGGPSNPTEENCYCKSNFELNALTYNTAYMTLMRAWPMRSILPTTALHYDRLFKQAQSAGKGSHIWYKVFRGNGYAYKIDTCAWADTYDTYINVFKSSTSSPYSLSMVTSNDDANTENCLQGSIVSFCTESSYFYWILVSYDNAYVADYTFRDGTSYAVTTKGDSCTTSITSQCTSSTSYTALGTLSSTCSSHAYKGMSLSGTYTSSTSYSNVAGCCSACTSASSCQAYSFTTSSATCKLYTALTWASSSTITTTGASVVSGNCAGFQLLAAVQLYATSANVLNSYTVTDLSTCCSKCSSLSTCYAWSLYGSSSATSFTCYLYANAWVVSSTSSSSYTSGIKTSSTLEIVAGYYYSGDYIKSYSSVTLPGCLDKCTATSGCSYIGYVGSTSYATSSCTCKLYSSASDLKSKSLSSSVASYFIARPVENVMWNTLSSKCSSGKTLCPVSYAGCGLNVPEILVDSLSSSTETIYAGPDEDSWYLKSSCYTLSKPYGGTSPADHSDEWATYSSFVSGSTVAYCCCDDDVLSNPVTSVATDPTCYTWSYSFDPMSGSKNMDSTGTPSGAKGNVKIECTITVEVTYCTDSTITITVTGEGSAPVYGNVVYLIVTVSGSATMLVSSSGWDYQSGYATIKGTVKVGNDGEYEWGYDVIGSWISVTIEYEASLSVSIGTEVDFKSCDYSGLSSLSAGCVFGITPTEPLDIAIGADLVLSASYEVCSGNYLKAKGSADVYVGFEVYFDPVKLTFAAWKMEGSVCLGGEGEILWTDWEKYYCWGAGLGDNEDWFDDLNLDESFDAQAALPGGPRQHSGRQHSGRQHSGRHASTAAEQSAPKEQGQQRDRKRGNLASFPSTFMPKQGTSLRDTLAADFTPPMPCAGIITQDHLIQGLVPNPPPRLAGLSGGRLLFCYPAAYDFNSTVYYLSGDSRCSLYTGLVWNPIEALVPSDPITPIGLGDTVSSRDGSYALGAFFLPVPFYKLGMTNDSINAVVDGTKLLLAKYVPGTGWTLRTATTKGPRIVGVHFAAVSPSMHMDVLVGVERGRDPDPTQALSSSNANITLWAMPVDPASNAAWGSTLVSNIVTGQDMDPTCIAAAASTSRVVVAYGTNDGRLMVATASVDTWTWTTTAFDYVKRSVDVAARDERTFVLTWLSPVTNATQVCTFDGSDLSQCTSYQTKFETLEMASPDLLLAEANQMVNSWSQVSPRVVALGDNSTVLVWAENSEIWSNPPLVRWTVLPANSSSISSSWSPVRSEHTGRVAPIDNVFTPSRVFGANSFWILELERTLPLASTPEFPSSTGNTFTNASVAVSVYAMMLSTLSAVNVDAAHRVVVKNQAGATVTNRGSITSGEVTLSLWAGDAAGPRAPLGVQTALGTIAPQATTTEFLNIGAASNASSVAALYAHGYVWVVAMDAASPSCPSWKGFIPGQISLSGLMMEGEGDGSMRACATLGSRGPVPRSLPLRMTALAMNNTNVNLTQGQEFTLATGSITLAAGAATGKACVDLTAWAGKTSLFSPPLRMYLDFPSNIAEAAVVTKNALLYADLVLSRFDVEILVAVTGALQARVTVHNIGGSAGCDIRLEAFIGATATSENIVGSLTMPSVLAYSSTTVVMTAASGLFTNGLNATITFYVNRNLVIFEPTMGNNAAQFTVAFQGAADLVITGPAAVNGGAVCFPVSNRGDGAALLVPFMIDSSRAPGAPAVVPTTVTYPAIGPGANVTVCLPLTCPTCPTNGSFPVAIYIDPKGQVPNLVPTTSRTFNATAVYAATVEAPKSGVSPVQGLSTSAPPGLSNARVIIAVLGSVLAASIIAVTVVYLLKRRARQKAEKKLEYGTQQSYTTGSGYGSYYTHSGETRSGYTQTGSYGYSYTQSQTPDSHSYSRRGSRSRRDRSESRNESGSAGSGSRSAGSGSRSAHSRRRSSGSRSGYHSDSRRR